MKIAVIVEGATEKAFKTALIAFLQARLSGKMPHLDFVPVHGLLPRDKDLRRLVDNLLSARGRFFDHVIALTDVYTGTNLFVDAADAKRKLGEWVGANPQFHPHAAQFEFEAWLLPYWSRITQLAKHNRSAPAGNPETVNHVNPPSKRIGEVFRTGKNGIGYSKSRDAARILKGQDLSIAVHACTELRAFVNTILTLCGEPVIE